MATKLTDAPASLSPRARKLWAALVGEWMFDTQGLVLLEVALQALDRLHEAREIIAREGLTVSRNGGLARVHPATRLEREARIGFLQAWRALGLGLDPPAGS